MEIMITYSAKYVMITFPSLNGTNWKKVEN